MEMGLAPLTTISKIFASFSFNVSVGLEVLVPNGEKLLQVDTTMFN